MKLLNVPSAKYFSLLYNQRISINLLIDKIISLFNNLKIYNDSNFKRKTALAVRLFKYIPRCPFYCTFFAFRRTGVHPPISYFIYY